MSYCRGPKSGYKLLPRNHPDGIHIAFDDHRLVNNAGLILPATLAWRLGLPQLVDRRLDLGHATGRANTGDKMMTLVASALAGGDCIDDADALLTGRTACALGCVVKAPSTPRFREGRLWGPSCAASGGPCPPTGPGEPGVASRAWAAGAGPSDAPFTIDLDSTICETYGLAKGGRPPPRLHRRAGLSPAAGRRRRHRRRYVKVTGYTEIRLLRQPKEARRFYWFINSHLLSLRSCLLPLELQDPAPADTPCPSRTLM